MIHTTSPVAWVTKGGVKVIIGDHNAKVGKTDLKNDICGKFGLGDINEKVEDFIEFCSTNNLVIANTLFRHHPRHLYTWISPDKRTRNQIDYIVLNHKWKSCIKNARTKPNADCNSDHQLLTIDFQIRLKKMERPTPPLKLDYKTLDNNYRIAVANKFELLNQCDDSKTPNELWEEGEEILLITAKETIAKKKKTNSPWISEETISEIETRRRLKSKGINNPAEEVIYKNQNAKIQRLLRRDKEKYLNEQCERIENCYINKTIKELYQGVRNITRKFKPKIDTIKTEDGLVLCDGKEVKDRWRQYCSNLYKKNEDLTITPTRLNDSDEPPPLRDEVRKAIR
ncbi:uncharacterized protein LOC122243475 [Penaeus japonicus]|uniref:uncharacterized protein LOC122243475 n=1 Tax=Penaeus japonicus TaxID=27405 RepID=UPI001C71737F|nr:uncharacterized protein LOC122243475 [Penaeus japonicus]